MRTKVGLGKERLIKIRGNRVEKGFFAPNYVCKFVEGNSDI